ncbi:MAG: methionyl-tRNA formyltransferase [Candidatus Omnitrophica bacterium]|nr:methionyl-tRNA formyltransferase [Candidatus Omnitrophota bacterium]
MNEILYFGSDSFGIPSLEELKKHSRLLGIVTSPDRPKGRGLKISCTPVKEWALKNNIPVYQPESLSGRDFADSLKNLKPELIVLISYGKILPCSVLEIPSAAAINVHPSLLPKYRGAAPMEWALINGEEETGITVMNMHCKMDAGGIIMQKKTAVDGKDDIFTLKSRLSSIAPDILIESIRLIKKGAAPSPQEGTPTYARKLTKEDGLIRWNKTAAEIYNLIRGTKEWPGAYTYINGKYLKIFHAEPGTECGTCGEPGEIANTGKDFICVACGGDTFLKIMEVQIEGKKRMPVREFLKGHKIITGDSFSETK